MKNDNNPDRNENESEQHTRTSAEGYFMDLSTWKAKKAKDKYGSKKNCRTLHLNTTRSRTQYFCTFRFYFKVKIWDIKLFSSRKLECGIKTSAWGYRKVVKVLEINFLMKKYQLSPLAVLYRYKCTVIVNRCIRFFSVQNQLRLKCLKMQSSSYRFKFNSTP